MALDLVSGEVKTASCTCVAGQIGFCNRILALLMKICNLRLYGCKDVSELKEEDDMQPTKACTSTLQLRHRKGRGNVIYPQPVMEISVKKQSLKPEITCEFSVLMRLNSKTNFSRLILQCHWHRFRLQEQVTKTN